MSPFQRPSPAPVQRFPLLRAFVLVLCAATAAATDFTWDGGGNDNNLSTAANWVGDVAPTGVATDNLVFTGSVRPGPSNDFVGATFGSITFNTGGFTLSGNALTITGNLTGNDGTSTMSANMTLGAAVSFVSAAGATLTISATVANAGFLLTTGAAGTVNLNGVVSGAGALTHSGTGLVNSGVAHTYSGGTTLSSGVLSLNIDSTGAITNGPVGTGTLTINGGTIVANATRTVANVLSIGGNFAFAGNQNITLSGATTVTGARTITNNSFGTITIGTGALTLNGDLSLAGIGNITFSGAVALPANRVITVAENITATFSGVISGGFRLTKNGLGVLLLQGANTYSGGTTHNAGVLAFNVSSTGAVTNGPVGTGTLTINAGANIRANSAARSIANAITVNGDFANDGSQDLTFTGNIALADNATISVSNSSTNGLVISTGVVSGAFALTFGGTKLSLSGANTFSGGFTLASGTLTINASSTGGPPPTSGPLGTGTFTILGGTVQASTSTRTIGNTLQLLGDFTVAGTVQLALSGSGTVPVPVQITDNNTTTDTTITGALSGAGGLIKAGNGTLALSGANTWTGPTVITAGTLKWGAANALADTTPVSVIAGTVDLNGNNDTIGSLAMLAGTVQTGAGTLTLGGTLTYAGTTTAATITGNLGLGGNRTIDVADGSAANDLDIQAVVSGAFSLTKAGAGVLKLSATNTWTGTTTISAGTMLLTGSINAASAVTVASGGTLTGTGTVNGTLAISGTVVPGNAAAGTLTAGAVTMSGTAALTYELGDVANAATSDLIVSTGAVALSGNLDVTGLSSFGPGTYSLFSCVGVPTGALTVRTMPAGYTGVVNLNNGSATLTVSAVTGTGNFVWTGNGGDNSFATGANWADGAAPTGAGGESLVFNGLKRQSPSNNLVGASFANITFNNGTFDVSGNAFTLTGTLLSSAGSNTISANIATTASRAVNVASGSTLTLSGVISGAGGALSLGGAGTVVLSGANTFDGGVTVSAGALSLGVDTVGTVTSGPVGTGTLTIAGGTVQATATRSVSNPVTFTGDFSVGGSSALTLSGAITCAGGRTLTLINSATTTFSGAFNPGGDLTLNGTVNATTTFSGALTISSARTITNNSTTGSQQFTGTLALDADLTVAGTTAITFSSGAATLSGNRTVNVTSSAVITMSGAIGESGGARTLTKAGSGQLTLSGANTYSGGTVLNAGTLAFGNNAGAGTGTLTINGGTIRADSAARTLTNAVTINASFSSDNNQDLFLSGPTTLTVSPTITVTNTAGNGLRFAGVMSGGFSVTKAGTGIMQYGAANTYSGDTTVNSGTLTLLGDSGTIAGNLVIGASTTVNIDATNSISPGANPDRIGNAKTITMQGGTLTMTCPSNVNRTETIAVLNVASGNNQITLTAAGTGNAQLTAGTVAITGALNLTRTNATGTANLFISAGFANGAPVPNTTVGGAIAAYDTTNGVVAASPSSATTKTTAQSGNWDVTATWVGGVVPSSTDEIIVASTHSVDLNGANRTINSVTFSGGGAITGDNTLTITSGALGVTGTGSPSVSCLIATGTSCFGIAQASSGALTITGAVSGSGGLSKTGSGKAVLSGTNTFTGAVSLLAGTLTLLGSGAYAGGTTVASGASLGIGDDQALGSGTLTLFGGTLFVEGADRTLTNAWVMNANVTTDGSFALTLSGTGTLIGGQRTVTVNNLPGLVLSGNIGEAVDICALTKNGSGPLTLSGQNTYGLGATQTDWSGPMKIGSSSSVDGSNQIISGPFGKVTNISWKSNGSLEAVGGPQTVHNRFFTSGTCFFFGTNQITLDTRVGSSGRSQIGNTGTTNVDIAELSMVVDWKKMEHKNAGNTLNMQGAGTLKIGDSTHAGPLNVNGGRVLLTGDSSVLAITSLTVATGGTFEIDNSGSANPDRIPDACTVTLNGGAFTLSAPANTSRTETVASITITGTGSRIILNPSGSGNSQLTASNSTGLARNGGDLRLTRGSSGGAGTANLFSPSSGFLDGQVVNWASVNGSARAQYSTSDGLVASTGTLFTTVANGNWDSNATWNLGSVPTVGDEVSIGHNISLNGADRTVRRVAITTGATLSASAGESLRILAGSLDVSGSGSPTVSCAIEFVTEASINQGSSGTLTVSGAARGSSGFTKAGSGTAIFSSTNRFAGNLNVVAGRLELSATNTFTGATAVRGGATLAVSGGNAIPDASTMTLAAGARLEVNSGIETCNLVGWSDNSSAVVSIANGAKLRLSGAAAPNVNAQITGAGTLVMSAQSAGSKPTLASIRNDLTGIVEVESGTLRFNTGCLPDTATMRITGQTGSGSNAHGILDQLNRTETAGALSGDGFLGNSSVGPADFSFGANNVDATFGPSSTATAGGAIGNAVQTSNGPGVNFIKVGTGSQTLSGNNVYTGTTTVRSGNLIAGRNAPSGSSGAFGNSTSSIVVGDTGNVAAGLLIGGGFTVGRSVIVQGGGGGTISLGGTTATTSTFSGAIALNRNTVLTAVSNGTCTFSAAITGGFAVTKSGAGTVALSGANTWSGGTTIAAGTLRLAGGSALVDTGSVTLADVAGAVLDLNGTSETIGSLAGGGATGGNVTLGAGTLTCGGNGTTTTFAGIISGNGGALVKAGSGTLTLSRAHTYTGATTVNAGTLSLTGSLDAGSAVSVAAGGRLAGTGTAAGTLALAGTLAPGVAGAGTLTTGAVTMASTAVLAFQLGDPAVAAQSDRLSAGDLVALEGNLDVSALAGFAGGTYTLITYTGATPTNNCTVRTMPSGFLGTLDLSEAGKVKLVVTAPVVRIEWAAGSVDSAGAPPATVTSALDWTLGSLEAASTAVDTITGDPTFTVRNTGDLAVDLTVTASASGLTLTTGTPGLDQFKLAFSTTGAAPFTAIPASPTTAAVASTVAINGTVGVDLQFTPPASTSTASVPATATVTVTAAASP